MKRYLILLAVTLFFSVFLLNTTNLFSMSIFAVLIALVAIDLDKIKQV